MRKLTLLSFCLLLVIPCQARIITVDDDEPADFNNIQAAINDANNGDIIEVQPGRYTGPGNRDIIFPDRKAITVRSTNPEDPCIVAATIIDCNGTESDPHRGFDISPAWRDCVLDGLTITNGYGPNENWGQGEHSAGGAIYLHGSSNKTISRCIIVGNSADYGGGISCIEGGGDITNCIFENNTAGTYGGGILCCHAWPIVEDCSFAYNSAGGFGGGIGSWAASPDVRHCTFTGNFAEGTNILDGGGGIGCVQGGSLTSHCIFTGNHASRGGGIHVFNVYDELTIINCSFYNNIASDYAGAVSYLSCGGDEAFISNSIIWNNEPSNDSGIVSMPSGKCGAPYMYVDYCILQGDWQTSGRINKCLVADPCFADAESGDYHLKSQAGRWDPDSESWVLDDVTGPGIDTGDPVSQIGSEPFPNGGRINMGAYGGTEEASKSFCGDRYSEEAVAADINGDCKIDWLDFAIMAFHWLEDNRE